MKDNPATRWLDGEISGPKMMQLLGVNRLEGEQLVGAVWQACQEKLQILNDKLAHQMDLCDEQIRLLSLANDPGDYINRVAETSRKRALQEALTQIRLNFGICIDRTSHMPMKGDS